MIVAVETTRGPSPVYVQVETEDERTARRVAFRFVYYGDTMTDDVDAEFTVTDAEIDEYTTAIKIAATVTPN
jgi:hypothetical protein